MGQKKISAPLGASLIVLSSIFYASYGVWTKLMGNYFGGYTASAFRSVAVLLILLPIALVYKSYEPINWKRNKTWLAGMTLAGLFVWGPLYYAVLHAGIGISLAINYASIVIGMFLFGWLFAGEQFTKDKLLSTALGLLGLSLIFIHGNNHYVLLPLFAAFISGLASACIMVMTKRVSYKATQTTLMLWVTSVIANFAMAFVIKDHFPSYHLSAQWLYLILFAIASVIASWSYVKGLKLIEAGAVGILGLLEIVFGVLFGVIFFHERPSVTALIGIVIIILAAALPYVKLYNEKVEKSVT